jgi:Spy/CpxP family protein refolding chaperone
MKRSLWLAFLLIAPFHALGQDRPSPYAGQQGRDIKALSEDEIQGYLTGQGMALAKAGELNHYPGPLHVLELAAQLKLSEAQKQQTDKVRAVMLKETTGLGKIIVDKERELDTLFASGKIDEAKLGVSVAEIARLQGELRVAHLRAHLKQKRILTADQVKRYDELRGYAEKDTSGQQHEGHQPGQH